jgi:hypothetical protein
MSSKSGSKVYDVTIWHSSRVGNHLLHFPGMVSTIILYATSEEDARNLASQMWEDFPNKYGCKYRIQNIKVMSPKYAEKWFDAHQKLMELTIKGASKEDMKLVYDERERVVRESKKSKEVKPRGQKKK